MPLNLLNNPNAKLAIKREISVDVRFAKDSGILQTLEGPVPYSKDDAIVTGSAGESWPINRENFIENYIPLNVHIFGENGRYIKKLIKVHVLQIDKVVKVNTKEGGILNGMPGDWLIQYAENEYGIVRDDIFRATYELLS